jgi:hypothetical protein
LGKGLVEGQYDCNGGPQLSEELQSIGQGRDGSRATIWSQHRKWVSVESHNYRRHLGRTGSTDGFANDRAVAQMHAIERTDAYHAPVPLGPKRRKPVLNQHPL